MKLIFFPLLVALLIFQFTSALGEEKITTIKVVAQEWPGQTSEDGSGLYFELLNKIYNPVGITVNTSIVPFDRAVMMLRNNTTDASVGFYSAEDAKLAKWYFYLTPQHPIDFEKIVAVFKKGSVKNWENPQSLKNHRVGWLQGYSFDANIKTPMDYQHLSSHKQAWDLLKFGRIEFYLDSEADIISSAQKNGVELGDYQLETMWEGKLYVPFTKTKKSQKLMEIFDSRMAEMWTSGELKGLYQKWERDLPPEK